MANQGDKANWSDITALYTKLKNVRVKFGFTPNDVTPASRQGGYPYPSDISGINTYISAMKSNANLNPVANPVTVPTQGELLRPSFVNTLSTTLDNMYAANNFGNSSYNSSYNSSFRSFNSWGNSSWGACNDNADCWWY